MSEQHHDRNNYLSMQDLQSKGWSRRMITRYLGTPDRVGSHTPGRAGRPSSFYCALRVNRIVSGEPALAEEFEQVQSFATRNQRVANERLLNMRSVVDTLQLPALTVDLALVLAEVRRQSPGMRSNADEHRLAVEHLLGTLVSTVDALETYSWHAGVCEARKHLENRLLAHIASTYPLLASAVSSTEALPSG